MDEFNLSAGEIKHLRTQHRAMKKKRDADRIKALVLLGSGWTIAQVCDVLLMDEGTIRRYRTRYEQGGLQGLLQDHYKGKPSKLDNEQLGELSAHLQTELYLTVQEIIVYVKKRYKVSYGISGMTDLLHRLGFVYNKPKVVPGKADPNAQHAFLDRYAELKETKGENDPIYFMDGTHPQHNKPEYGVRSRIVAFTREV